MRIGILYPYPLSYNNNKKKYLLNFIRNKIHSNITLQQIENNKYYYLDIWNIPNLHTININNVNLDNVKNNNNVNLDNVKLECIKVDDFVRYQNYMVSTKFIYRTYLQYKEYLLTKDPEINNINTLQLNIFKNDKFKNELEKYIFTIITWIKEYGIQRVWCLDAFFLKFLEELSYLGSVNKSKITILNNILDVYWLKDINYHNNTNIFTLKEINECIDCITCRMNEPFYNITFDNQEMYQYFLKKGIHTKHFNLDKKLSYLNLLMVDKSELYLSRVVKENIKQLFVLLFMYQGCNSLQDWDLIYIPMRERTKEEFLKQGKVGFLSCAMMDTKVG